MQQLVHVDMGQSSIINLVFAGDPDIAHLLRLSGIHKL
jgi:hypothetical protein